MEKASSALPDLPESGIQFCGFRMDALGRVFRRRSAVELPREEALVLRMLLAHAGHVVSPSQLRRALWGDARVPAESVSRCIASLRARLDLGNCIEAVYKRGYRFTCEVLPAQTEKLSRRTRLAVLPFTVDAGLPEHLGPALCAETAICLSDANDGSVAVVAQESVNTLARRGYSALQVGQALGADMVLTGQLHALSAQLRLRAEMSRCADGKPLWTEDLVVEQGQIEDLVAELVRRIALRLGSGVSMAAEDGGEERGPGRPQAYELLLRARCEGETLQRHSLQDALQRLQRAIELDPSLIPARIELTNLCISEALYGYMAPATAAGLVRRAAGSLALANSRAEPLLPALGWIHFHVDRNLPAALEAFSRAAHLTHDPSITRARAMFALSRHRFGEARELLRAALAADPYAAWLHAQLAWALHLSGEGAESLRTTEHALQEFPEHEGVCFYAAIILAFQGQFERAVGIAESLARCCPYLDAGLSTLAYTLACAGRRDEARDLVERLDWLSRERYVLNAFTPAAYLALGDQQSALEELAAANAARCPWIFQMLADPRLRPLRGRPQFESIRAELEQMEASAAS